MCMATAGALLGVLVIIAVVTGMVTIGGRFRHEPRR
jgi:hypothetical protein